MINRARALALAFALAAVCVPYAPAPAMAREGFILCGSKKRVNCVVDGDTLWLKRTKVRLAGIDAPELSEPRCASEAALAERATLRLLDLINAGGWVASGSRRDIYGRRLMTFTVGQTDLGNILVSEGLARPYRGHRQPWCP